MTAAAKEGIEKWTYFALSSLCGPDASILFFLLFSHSFVLYEMGQICPWPRSLELNEATFGTLKTLDKCSACSLRL